MEKRTAAPLTPEQFILIWQQAGDIVDVMEKTGWKYATCTGMAAKYRRRGIPLQRFPRGRQRYDWAALAELAKGLKPKPRRRRKRAK